MDLKPYLNGLSQIPMNLSRDRFLESLKAVDQSVYEYMKKETLCPWYPGKGRETVSALCGYRDAVIDLAIRYAGGCPKDIAVIAVGGYGRGELSPFSDIDILLLHGEKAPIEEFARSFLYLLWDMNYHVGSSTRTVSNVLEHAAKDETFMTSVFEARFLCGDRELFGKMRQSFGKLVGRLGKEYFHSKYEEIYGILEDSGAELLLKEPNLKKSPGGLRSVHLMEWLNFVFNGERSFEGLKQVLPARTYKRLSVAHDYVTNLRNMLHYIHNRSEDNLYLDYSLTLSNYLGMKGDEMESMDRLMRHYYEKTGEIYLTLLYLVDHLHVRSSGKLQKLMKKGLPFVHENHFYVPESFPPAVDKALELVLQCSSGGHRMTDSLVRYLKRVSFELSDTDRYSGNSFFRLRAILESGHSYGALNILKISGFLYRFIPLYSQIRHQVLYNPFHKYTVDQHSVETIGALEFLSGREFDPVREKKFIHFQEILARYGKNAWILKLALLLHDVGKAMDGDHARNGVEMATAYLKKQPMYRSYIQAIQFLIQNHLLLSMTVRRSDISSREVLSELSRELFFTTFPKEYMDFLYLLTFADIYATNPKNFTGYLSDMLTQVYTRVTDIMERRESADYRKNLLDEAKTIDPGEETGSGLEKFLDDLGEGYFLTKSTEEVLDDYRALCSVKKGGQLIQVHVFNDYIKAKFFVPDRIGLFSFLCGILFLNGSDIAKAGIYTCEGIALDEFTITRVFGNEFSDRSRKEQVKTWKEDLEKLFNDYRNNPEGLEKRILDFKKHMKPLPRVFAIDREVKFGELTGLMDEKVLRSLEISCMDRPALLYDVSNYLASRNVDIIQAIVDTSGWYVKDFFEIVTDKNANVFGLEEDLKRIIDQDGGKETPVG